MKLVQNRLIQNKLFDQMITELAIIIDKEY